MFDAPCREFFPALRSGFPPTGEKTARRIRAYARRSQAVTDKPGKQRGISRRSSIYNRFYGRRSAVFPSVFPLTGRVLLDGDRIDLDLRTHRQLGYLIADACGHILRKERGVNGVHRGEIGDVGEQDRRFHDIGVGITRLFEDVPRLVSDWRV